MAGEYKVLVLGASEAGKSALMHRLSADEFAPGDSCRTAGADLYNIEGATASGEKVTLHLWDCGGSEKALPMIQSVVGYDGSAAALLVFAVDSISSFEETQFWMNELKREASKSIKLFLVGTKGDLTDSSDAGQISVDQGETQAAEWNAKHLRVSASNGDGTRSLLTRLVKAVTSSE